MSTAETSTGSAGSTPSTAHGSQGPPPERPPAPAENLDRRTLWSGFLFGCGIAASIIDLFIFHLALQWHSFYDLSTTEIAITTDGFFSAFGWFITVGGLFLLADVRRRGEVVWKRWTGAVITGLGFFQLLDGVVSHKILGIHQIRYGVDLLVYDVIWIGTAILALVIGLVILRRTRRAG